MMEILDRTLERHLEQRTTCGMGRVESFQLAEGLVHIIMGWAFRPVIMCIRRKILAFWSQVYPHALYCIYSRYSLDDGLVGKMAF